MYIHQIDTALKHKLKPVYLISGDVPLLMQETRDKIRHAAKQANYLECELWVIESGFNWETLRQRLRTRSLFSEKSIIDIRLPKWEPNASKCLLEYFSISTITDDLLLILSTSKLTSAQQKTKWYKTIGTIGETITVWPIQLDALPQWIQQRFNTFKLQADSESIQLLAEWTEGNLLATQQAIEKLHLLYPHQKITLAEMTHILNDNARFSVFDFTNAMLIGNAKRVARIFPNLNFEGIEPTLILWAITREIRSLIQLLDQKERGTPIHQLLQKEWQSRKALINAALQRQNKKNLLLCLQKASRIDKMIKGLKIGNYWNALESLALSVASS